jgi:hypothetical protein
MKPEGDIINKLPQYPSSNRARGERLRSAIVKLTTDIRYLETLISQMR